MAFQKATKKQARLRAAIIGTSGSGKTYTALKVATGIIKTTGGGRIALADSERASASKYADIFDFDAEEMNSFSPEDYVRVIAEAEAAHYSVLVIDSLSHAWMGKNGALEQVDRAAARSSSKNSFGAWREVTPMHNAMIDAILRSSMHIIATMRSKTEWVIEEDERGKKVPRKIGMAPVQRDGMEYEFDLVCDMDADNTMIVTKSRCPDLSRAVLKRPGEELGKQLAEWLGAGEPPDPALTAALDTGFGLISSLPFSDVGAALKSHLASVPESVREEARAKLLSAYKTREAVEHAH